MNAHSKFLARLRFTKGKANIIAAPMNGGFNTPNFCASVINAGGVASFGFTYHTSDKIVSDMAETRAHTSGGIINANFFVFDDIKIPSDHELMTAANDLSLKINIPKPDLTALTSFKTIDRSAQMEAVWKSKPDLLTFHFGLPPKEIMREARKNNILVGITATSYEEAMLIQEFGADFIIAQGVEAGGHRGVFNSSILNNNIGKYVCIGILYYNDYYFLFKLYCICLYRQETGNFKPRSAAG